MNRYPPNLVRDFLDQHPEGNFADFKLKTGSKMGSRNFSYIKIRYRKEKAGLIHPNKTRLPPPKNGEKAAKRPYIRRQTATKVYSGIYSVSVEKFKQDPLAAFSDFIAMLNRTKRVNCELIELKNPNNIEVREITR